MRLDELLDAISQSSEHDWKKITLWGSGSGPSLLPEGNYDEAAASEGYLPHGERAVYLPSVSIGLAWGATSHPNFQEDWANQFPDPKASSQYVDVLFNGMLAYRAIRVMVDGARCGLPLPTPVDDELLVTPWQVAFMRLVQRLESLSDYDSYVSRAGFTTRENTENRYDW